jgi:2-hydroxycyclohexanecarboxyl-CoA dehydrogenase
VKGLDGKLAVVTGGAGGIGSAISRRLAAEGCRVAVTDIDLDGARNIASEIGGTAHRLDISDAAAAAALAADLGTVDVLVNNAGWDRAGPFLDTAPDFWERNLAINLRGPIGVTHAFARGMSERNRGRIVFIASDAGRVGSSFEVVYSGAKGGIIAFAKGLARELARNDVTVNTVCPGPTDTPLLGMFEGERGKKILEGMKRAIPMRRFATPDEVAAAVAFFASDDAAYITGQTLSVSGGLTMA